MMDTPPVSSTMPARYALRAVPTFVGCTQAAMLAVIFSHVAGAQRAAAAGAPTARIVAARDERSASAANASCLACHGMPNLGYRDSTPVPRSFAVSPGAFNPSVHRDVACVDCHQGASTYPHEAGTPATRVTCATDCHATDSAGRPYTHAKEVASFGESVHGRAADRDNPTCLTCHGAGDAHAVSRVATATPAVKAALCVSCHADTAMMRRHDVAVGAVASYERSFHYKAIRFGDTTTATCTDCHTAHHVLPPSDARSTIAPGALARTCGATGCHAGAALNFASSGANHLELRVAKEPILFFEERFFMVLTAGTLAMLVVGIVLDIQKKFGWSTLVRSAAVLGSRRLRRVVVSVRRAARVSRPWLARSGRATVRVARVVFYE